MKASPMQEETILYTPPQSTTPQPAPLYTPPVITPGVQTPVVAPVAVAPVSPLKSFVLKQSGIKVAFNPKYSVDSVFYAQKMSSKDSNKMPWYLCQTICTFDGVKLNTTEMSAKITGADYFQLIGAVMGTDEEDGAGE
jgi:hypothetical protein